MWKAETNHRSGVKEMTLKQTLKPKQVILLNDWVETETHLLAIYQW